MKAANRVAINTGFLYGKMILSMIISLITVRLVLNALGAVDYGIYHLVAGVIAMLSFLNSAMTIATQRYLSYYLGAGDIHKMKQIFNSSVLLHLIIGIILILLLEAVGVYLFNGFLNIPQERLVAAKILFHFMVIGTFFTVNAVPYDAAINSHENMLFDSLIGIFESIMKLGIAYWVVITEADGLLLYGALIAGLIILIRIIKGLYCYRKYEECKVKLSQYLDISLFKEMFSFAGWNLYGSFCWVVRNQGLAILLNVFFGVVVNAAYGIANQVNGQIIAFSTNMMKALNPQIVKSEGSGDHQRMLRLAMLGCKLSFFLYSFFAIPLILEMPFILKIWLKNVPEYTIIFCRLILILSLFMQFSSGLMVAVSAVGKIRAYQLIMGSLLLMNIPIAFILIKLGYPAYSVIIGSIFIEIIALSTRIWLSHKIAKLSIIEFLVKIIMPSSLVAAITIIVTYVIGSYIEDLVIKLIYSTLSSISLLLLLGRYIALSPWEFQVLKGIFEFLLEKFHGFIKVLRI
jgi:O-antigen/teichoic acid export membrane protein